MKKFILIATVIVVTTAVYQPLRAQVSINVNIGTPAIYHFQPNYISEPTIVYVNKKVRNHHNNNYYPKRDLVVYSDLPYAHRSSKYRKSTNYYSVKNVAYDHHNKSIKYLKVNKKGRH